MGIKTKIKSIVHYRRHFASPDSARRRSRDRFGRIATGEDIMFALRASGAPALLPRRRDYVIESVGDHYRSTMPGEQMDVAKEVLADLEPVYLPAFDRVLSGRTAHLFNMMVMRTDVLDGYCSWLFPVLDEVCRRLDPASYDPFNARYPGRVSERMLDAWLATEGIPYAELPTVSPEPVDWIRKGSSFLAARFLGKKYGRSF